ncbi:MAG: hypothetical protein AAF206_03855 [Bacteroidota bacterium]
MPQIPLSSQQVEWLRKSLEEKLTPAMQQHGKIFLVKKNFPNYELPAEIINQQIADTLNEQAQEGNKLPNGKDLSCTAYLLYKIFVPQEDGKPFRLQSNKVAALMLYLTGEASNQVPIQESSIEPGASGADNEAPTSVKSIPAGKIQLLEQISEQDISRKIVQSQEEVWLMDTYIGNWDQLKDALKRTVENHQTKVKIIISNPFGEFVKLRYGSLGLPRSIIKAKTKLFELAYDIRQWQHEDQVEVRSVEHNLGVTLYRMDEEVFTGLFLFNKISSQNVSIEGSRDRLFKKAILRHFEGLWETGEALNLGEIIDNYDIYNNATETSLRPYIGTWHLYCTHQDKHRPSHTLNSASFSNIGKNVLHITEDNYLFHCQLHSEYLDEYKGKAYLEDNTSFFSCRLENQEKNSTIQFIFHKGSGIGDHLFGLFYTMHAETPILASGVAILQKASNDASASIIETNHPNGLEAIPQAFVRYLTHTQITRLDPLYDFQGLQTHPTFSVNCPYKGLYYVYAYHRRNAVFITRTVLEITPFYTVRLKRQRNANQLSEGRLDIVNDNQVVISFQNTGTGQMGFFHFTGRKGHRGKEEIISGIFSGLANDGSGFWPVSNRFILEPIKDENLSFDTIEPDRLRIHSPAYNQLPESVRKALSGRVNNLIGFMQNRSITSFKRLEDEVEKEINMSEVFFDSACQKALNDRLNECGRMIRRAVEHGLDSIDPFFEKLGFWQEQGLIMDYFIPKLTETKDWKKAMELLKGAQSSPPISQSGPTPKSG